MQNLTNFQRLILQALEKKNFRRGDYAEFARVYSDFANIKVSPQNAKYWGKVGVPINHIKGLEELSKYYADTGQEITIEMLLEDRNER